MLHIDFSMKHTNYFGALQVSPKRFFNQIDAEKLHSLIGKPQY